LVPDQEVGQTVKIESGWSSEIGYDADWEVT